MDKRTRFEELLEREFDGTLTDAERAELAALEASDTSLAEVAGSERALMASLGGLATIKAPPSLMAGVLDRLNEEDDAAIIPIGEERPRRRKLPFAVAAAASIAALLAVGSFLHEGREGATGLTESAPPEEFARGQRVESASIQPEAAANPNRELFSVSEPPQLPALSIPEVTGATAFDMDQAERLNIMGVAPQSYPNNFTLKSAPGSELYTRTAGEDHSDSFATAVGSAEAADPPGRRRAGSPPPADVDELPLPDRATVSVLAAGYGATLLADTPNRDAAIRYLPAAAGEVVRLGPLPPHRYAVFALPDAARAMILANEFNIRFPNVAFSFGDSVLVVYGRSNRQPDVIAIGPRPGDGEALGPGISGGTDLNDDENGDINPSGVTPPEEFFPGPAPIQQVDSLQELLQLASQNGATMPQGAIPTTGPLVLEFRSSTEAERFLTFLERSEGPGIAGLNRQDVELLTRGPSVLLIIPRTSGAGQP
jgi:hypothetical protein